MTQPSTSKRQRLFATLCALSVTLSLVLAMTPKASADPADPPIGASSPPVAATPPVTVTTPPIADATPQAPVPMGVTWRPVSSAPSPAPSFSGYIPPQFDSAPINDGTYAPASGALKATALPATYDLRSAHPTWLSGLRDQGAFGTCWAFAASESAETSLVRNGVLTGNESAKTKQLSPLHLVQSVYYTNTYSPLVTSPLATGGAYQLGGNDFMTATAWAHWYGAQKESNYPYPTNQTVVPARLTAAQLQSSVYHLKNQWILPAPRNSNGSYSAANVATIKQAVYQYGGALTAFTGSHLKVAPYYNSSTKAFYDATKATSDHAVLIIGWDDNFAVSNFTTKPPGPGAFLIQNSWGTDTSYFYLSYYDTTMVTSSIFDMVSATTTANYQDPYGWTDQYAYDQLGLGTAISYPTPTISANKFTARQNSTLRAIEFMATEPNMTYQFSVYVGNINSNSPTSGGTSQVLTASGSKTITGTLTYAGYNTVTLDKPVALQAGQTFSIVMTQTDTSKYYVVPVEAKWTNAYYSMNLTIASGQSYMNYGGYWYDLTSMYQSWNVNYLGNVNIIALTSPLPTSLVTLNANGGTVTPPNMTVTYSQKFGTLPTPARIGYTFNGWYTAPSGGTKYTSSTVVPFIGDTSIYAQWTANKYTAKFNANGGKTPTKSNKKYTSKTVTFDKAYGALPTTKRTGYSFAGWFTAKTDGTQVTSTTPVSTAGNHTLYAHWMPKTYKVKLKPGKGALEPGDPASLLVTYKSTYGPLPIPIRNGYTFKGWYTKTSGGSKITALTKVKITATQTLYARWKRTA